ncbi:MAG: glutathione-disulfide reductase [Gammaproteobacteria bacterium]|nr:MAG: glutathione-disulfide reductase [Gammaproteobacteria bacterium]
MAEQQYDYDLFVIGAGSGGVRAARMSAQHGARVAIAEQQYLGGTCVNVGCVPKKLFVYAASFHEEFTAAAGFGWQMPPATFDWSVLRDNKNTEIARLNGIYDNLLKNAGVTLFNARAVVESPHEVLVDGQKISCRYILVCTGGQPFVPDFPGSEHVITSDQVFFLDKLPEVITVVGGGYISVEFAGIFNGLGVETHLDYRGPLFLKSFDQDLREILAEQMAEKGVHLHFDTEVNSIARQGDTLISSLSNGEELASGLVMYATGRTPNIQNLGLDNTEVVIDKRGCVVVDEQFQTNEASVYAIGDVIGRVELTPVAIQEGMILAANLFNGGNAVMDYDFIPTAVFSQPNLATVGYTEQQAQQRFDKIDVYSSRFKPMKETLGGGADIIFMKLIVDALSDRVVGCHMLGEGAGELIQGLAVAIKAGATKNDFDATVGIHPTAAEEFVTMRTSV